MNNSGQSMVEYAFIIGLIALVVMVLVIVFGNELKGFYDNIYNSLVST